MRYKVLSARRYSFADEKDPNRMIRGCKIMLTAGNHDPQVSDAKGLDVVEVNAEYAMYDSLPDLPADCEVEVGFARGGKSKIASIAVLPRVAAKAVAVLLLMLSLLPSLASAAPVDPGFDPYTESDSFTVSFGRKDGAPPVKVDYSYAPDEDSLYRLALPQSVISYRGIPDDGGQPRYYYHPNPENAPTRFGSTFQFPFVRPSDGRTLQASVMWRYPFDGPPTGTSQSLGYLPYADAVVVPEPGVGGVVPLVLSLMLCSRRFA